MPKNDPQIDDAMSYVRRNFETQRMVGEFLQDFAYLESKIDDLIQAAFEFDVAQSFIFSANTVFQRKLYISSSILEFIFYRKDEIKKHRKTINSISKISGDRNIIAHYGFGPPDEGDGIKFFYYKSEGQLKVEPLVCTKESVK
jgi:hypothetical protein